MEEQSRGINRSREELVGFEDIVRTNEKTKGPDYEYMPWKGQRRLMNDHLILFSVCFINVEVRRCFG